MRFSKLPAGLLDEAFNRFRAKEYSEAHKLFVAAHQHDQTNPLLSYYVGATLGKLGRRREARQFFKMVLANRETDEALLRDATIRLIEFGFDLFRHFREEFSTEPQTCSYCGEKMSAFSEKLTAQFLLEIELFCEKCHRTATMILSKPTSRKGIGN